ncbi:MAG: T9SS type A sorting domain-containing protein [Bacteroidales bacterium]|nr:T9SS type A sorting domain-containing protein [Bacteroidales bacterium]
MRRVWAAGLLLMVVTVLNGQAVKDFKPYPVPESYRLKSGETLPAKWDNTRFGWFPEVFNQAGWSCNQASSIGYVLTYELNRIRGTNADDPSRLYTPGFVYSFLNGGNYGVGVSYFDSWEIVKAAGCPNYIDYSYYSMPGVWMSGYDRYYRAMQNRISGNYSIPVGTPEGLDILKHFLFDRFDPGSGSGGIASFQIASGGIQTSGWYDPDTGENWPVITTFGSVVGHAMTFVGWNDSVRVDLNGDGRYTNDVDINGDGEVNMSDWETGALKVVNSWGKGWGHGGMVYMLYNCLTRDGYEGGIWNKSVHVIEPVKAYEPQLTLRIVMEHRSKEKFRVLAGIAENLQATTPEQLMSFPLFNYQGGDLPLEDLENEADSARFEYGLDITPLLSKIKPGETTKFFLIIEERDPMNQADGVVREFALNDYTGGEMVTTLSDDRDVPVVNDGWTVLSLEKKVDFNKLQLVPPDMVSVDDQSGFSVRLEAEGGTPPYTFELVKDYRETSFVSVYQPVPGDTLLKNGVPEQFARVDLPFLFPFYGKSYDAIFIDRNGAIHFDNAYYQYPYVVNWDLVFKVRKSIVPFGMELSMTAPDDKVCCLTTDSVVTVSWNVSYHDHDQTNYDIRFAAGLYPDGVIEFKYGNQERPPQKEIKWTTGISNGDGKLYKYSMVNNRGMVVENYGVRFSPLEYPGDLSLSSDGLLQGFANRQDYIWNILVQVRDAHFQTTTGAIPVSTVNWDTARILHQNYPNPFNRTTVIFFRIPGQQRVRLEVFDTRGRCIRTLTDQTLLAGNYNFLWNARDQENREVQPGIYFYRLIAGDKRMTGKMVLIR